MVSMKFIAPFALILSQMLATHAFVLLRPRHLATVAATSNTGNRSRQSSMPLFMSEESSNEEKANTETPAESQAPAAPEDPEIVAIKEEIAKLESTLKEKRRELDYAVDKADEYTKSGYARKVAEMENMRRARSMLASSNKSGAMAGVLASFLPTLDTLGDLQNKYGEDDFGKSYNALQSVMRQVFTDLGANEYGLAAGDAVDTTRMDVVETEYSEQYAKDTVIQPLKMGWELQGNVIRSAQCVASLGSENAVEETPPEKKAASPGKPIDPTEHMQYGEEGTK